MPPYVFPGYPSFLQAAEEELGLPDSAEPARRISALGATANLCAQAAHAPFDHVAGILVKAAEFRDQLAVALRASERMIADVQAGRKPEPSPPVHPNPIPVATADLANPRPSPPQKGRGEGHRPSREAR